MKKTLAAIGVGLATLVMTPGAALATASDLTNGRYGFWTRTYQDPLETGRFGAYRVPDDGGNGCYTLPDWLDNPRSLWNRSTQTIYVYRVNGCDAYDANGGRRWIRSVPPGRQMDNLLDSNWGGIQSVGVYAP